MNRMGCHIISIIFLIPIMAHTGKAGTPRAMMDSARSAYDAGNYSEALEHYRKLAKQYHSPSLYYNMGNAALRAGELGKAVRYYRIAEKRAPWDPDIQNNLRIASEKTRDDFEGELKESGILSAIENFVVERPLGKWWDLAFIASLLSGAMLVLIAFRKARSHGPEWIVFFLFLFLSGIFFSADLWRAKILENEKGAVILKPSVKIRSEPSQEASTAFVLHEGTTVELRDRKDGWTEIRTPDDQVGWIRNENAGTF